MEWIFISDVYWVKMLANTECYAILFSISSCPLHTGFLCPSPKFMYIWTMIPTPSAHDVKQLWSENTKPSVIVAVNGLIGQNMKMQKWKMGYHRDCQKEPRRTPGMRRYVESQNLCQCLFRREHRETSIFSPRWRRRNYKNVSGNQCRGVWVGTPELQWWN